MEKPSSKGRLRRLSISHLAGLILALGIITFGINFFLLSKVQFDHAEWQNEPRDTSIFYFDKGEPSPRFCNDIENGGNGPLICGHGGDKDSAAVNTFLSFSKAISESGAGCLEMDASLTADGHLVVLHSREITSRLGRSVRVDQFSLVELQRVYDANGEDEGFQVPLLFDALKEFSPLVSEIIVDIKDTGAGIASRIVETVRQRKKHGVYSDLFGSNSLGTHQVLRAECKNCLLWSKDDAVVEELVGITPEMQIGLIVRNETIEDYEKGSYEPMRINDAQVLAVHYEMVNATLVDLAHSRNKRVHGWTADKEWMMKMMLLSGVDAIVTSYPKRLSEIIAKWRKICKRRAEKRQFRLGLL